jgi:1-acyl-sn-glycerol-3-phosphate acyltransferase
MILIRSTIFNILFYGMTVVMVVIGLPLLLTPRRVVMVYASMWALMLKFLLYIVGISHRIYGPRPEGQVIYAAKHQSAWETVILYHEFGHPAPVMKRELIFLPVLGLYFLRMASVPVNRASGSKALRALMESARKITAAGHSILIFPQGTRVTPGHDHPYHAGTFALYRTTGLPVVPVALNSGLFWPRDSYLKSPGVIDVILGEAIPPGLDRETFMARIEDHIENAAASLPGMAADKKTR